MTSYTGSTTVYESVYLLENYKRLIITKQNTIIKVCKSRSVTFEMVIEKKLTKETNKQFKWKW